MRLVAAAVCATSLVLAAAAFAEDTPLVSAQRPALEKLAGSVGVWETTTRYRWTPESPVFESHSVETTQWSAKGNFLISDQRGTTPDGRINRVLVTTWDPSEKLYKLVAIYAGGETEQQSMTIDGSVHTVVRYLPVEGRLIRCELKVEIISPTETKSVGECTDRGTNWIFSEARSKKTQ